MCSGEMWQKCLLFWKPCPKANLRRNKNRSGKKFYERFRKENDKAYLISEDPVLQDVLNLGPTKTKNHLKRNGSCSSEA